MLPDVAQRWVSLPQGRSPPETAEERLALPREPRLLVSPPRAELQSVEAEQARQGAPEPLDAQPLPSAA